MGLDIGQCYEKPLRVIFILSIASSGTQSQSVLGVLQDKYSRLISIIFFFNVCFRTVAH